MAKRKKTTKRNPQDLTVRYRRATAKRLASLRRQLQASRKAASNRIAALKVQLRTTVKRVSALEKRRDGVG